MWHHTELRLGRWFYCQYSLNIRDLITNLCGACVSEQNTQLETSVQFHPFVAIQWAINWFHFGIRTHICIKPKRMKRVTIWTYYMSKQKSSAIWLVSRQAGGSGNGCYSNFKLQGSQVYCIGFPVIYRQNKQATGKCLPHCTCVLITQQDKIISLW